MKRLTLIALAILIALTAMLILACCEMSSTPSAISDRYEDVAGGYKADTRSGNAGDSATFTFEGVKTFNCLVLKERGEIIDDYEVIAHGKTIYRSEAIGRYKYCSFPTVTTDSVAIKVNACRGKWKIRDIEAYLIQDSYTPSFTVTSYIMTDRAYRLNESDCDMMSASDCFNLFGGVYFDKDGGLHMQDFLIGGRSIKGEQAMRGAVSNIRRYNPSASIVCTLLGNKDLTRDGLDTQARHSSAMGEHADALADGCNALVSQFGLDGVSFDYEYPRNRKESEIYSSFLTKLRKTLPGDKLLTAAFSLWNIGGRDGIPVSVLNTLSRVELMTYDGFDGRGNHSAFYNMCAKALHDLDKMGLDISKADLGIPFYCRATDRSTYASDYASAADRLGEWGDSLYNRITSGGKSYDALCYYNGRQTVYDKTCYALDTGAGGVMVWHYSCDSSDSELSLYGAIKRAVASRRQ